MIELMAVIVSDIGLGLAIATPVLLIGRCGFAEGRRLTWVLAATAVAVLVLQWALMRPRPDGMPLYVAGVPFYGFPSGHAAIAVAAATYVFALRPSVRAGWALIGAAIVAVMRVQAGVHFYTDVVAGAALGAGIAIAGHGIAHDPTRKAWSWLLFPWLGLMVAMSAWATAGLGSVNTMFFTNADKVIHLIVFGLCGFFTVAWTRPGRPAAVLGGLVGIVLLEEAMQGLWPGRSVDIMDALASTSGVVIFGLLASAMARARAKPIADHLGAGPPPQTD